MSRVRRCERNESRPHRPGWDVYIGQRLAFTQIGYALPPGLVQQVLPPPPQLKHGQVMHDARTVKSWQPPPTQTWLRSHTVPQPPQFKGSLRRSWHSVPQIIKPPPVHEAMSWQLPRTQVRPAVHVWPTVPQLAGSLCRLTQLVPTSV